MARPGLRKVQRYSLEFKRTAVRLSRQRGISVQAVAAALDIHPFMLSRWRTDAREGRLRGGAGGPERPRAPRRELARLARLEREHAWQDPGARAGGGALGEWRCPSYLSGDNAARQCAW